MADRDRLREEGPLTGIAGGVILHIDMDTFFVSVERALDPRLEGRPVMVGGSPGGRGVIVACSYEVRERGVRAGMPTGRAIALAPDAIHLPSRHRAYRDISAEVFRLFRSIAGAVEPTSVDEGFVDLTGEPGGFAGAVRTGERLRLVVRGELGLPASVGIGPTRMVAKVASQMAKPDGIFCIPPEKIAGELHPLPVSAIGGVGEKTGATLRAMGIRTIGDLAAVDEEALRRRMGKNGASLVRLVRCEADRRNVPFAPAPDPKSMSNERTLARDTDDPELIDSALLYLTEKLAGRLRRDRLAGDTFHIKLRFPGFRTLLRSKALPRPTNDEKTLLAHAREGVRRHGGGGPFRLIGVGLSRLSPAPSFDGELDFDRSRRRYREALPVFDAVRERFGREMLRKARLL